MSSDIFQRKLNESLEGLKGTLGHPDVMYRRNRVHIRKDTVPEEAVPTAQMSSVHRKDHVEMAPSNDAKR